MNTFMKSNRATIQPTIEATTTQETMLTTKPLYYDDEGQPIDFIEDNGYDDDDDNDWSNCF